jgi:hypothetical protein
MTIEPSRADWRKSRYSGNTGNCVEIADLDAYVGVRDSKDTSGAVLAVSVDGWRLFVQRLKEKSL